MPSQYFIPPWGSTQTYKQFDAIYGINEGSSIYSSPYHYATQDSVGQHPSGVFVYNITSISSVDDIVTVNFTQTGSGPNVAPGSVVEVRNTASNNYTGMAIAGSNGSLQFINPGFDDTAGAVGQVRMLNPAWSTGYFFVPTYTSKFQTQNQPIVTKMGGGYVQRMSQGLNPFEQNVSFVYRDIDKRQMKAITNYVQNAAGVYPFQVMLPDQFLNNQPRQKWVANSVDTDPASFGLYNVVVQMERDFNP